MLCSQMTLPTVSRAGLSEVAEPRAARPPAAVDDELARPGLRADWPPRAALRPVDDQRARQSSTDRPGGRSRLGCLAGAQVPAGTTPSPGSWQLSRAPRGRCGSPRRPRRPAPQVRLSRSGPAPDGQKVVQEASGANRAGPGLGLRGPIIGAGCARQGCDQNVRLSNCGTALRVARRPRAAGQRR
ncbi:MAG: hypothetical protein QOJ83_156 [Frankiales bacterium]|jgi:hypothetical protein|nr:hypothetical protein [Frankiales bacterium]